MTRTLSYRNQGKKPIRKDRVVIAGLVLLVIILIPVLIWSGRDHRDAQLAVIDDTQITDPVDDVVTDDDAAIDDIVDPVVSERLLAHTVEDGESIAGIAATLGVPVANLLASNRLFGGEQLQPGQVLYASTQGIVHIIQPGQTLSDIARSYAVPLATLTAANELTTSSMIFAGDRILIPGATTSFWDNAIVLSRGVPTRFIWPLEGEVLSGYGFRIHPVLGVHHHHDGIDIDVPEGTTVYATAAGEVFFYGEQPGYGNLLIIKHEDGFYSFYGHLLDSFVFAGQFVEMGQAVARSGNTGISSGPHLHFELRNREHPLDPLRFLP